jgi:hypothetical protein
LNERLAGWWTGGVSPRVKLVYLVLLANGMPAFVILMIAPGATDDLFVWTVAPGASARLLGVMYGNALLLVAIGALQPDWPRARVTFVVIAFFSVAATVVTLFNLDPFLNHPWTHLAYWLSMYVILFAAAPLVFALEERAHGGRLPVQQPLRAVERALAFTAGVVYGAAGLALLIDPGFVSDLWPWKLTPLVGRMVGVWFTALALAYGWALGDGDRVRSRPIFLQGIVTGPLLALLPLLHTDDVRDGAGAELLIYFSLAALLAISGFAASLRPAAARAGSQHCG